MISIALHPGEVAARIAAIATHLPEQVLCNEALVAVFSDRITERHCGRRVFGNGGSPPG